jgi:hypothetical protein
MAQFKKGDTVNTMTAKEQVLEVYPDADIADMVLYYAILDRNSLKEYGVGYTDLAAWQDALNNIKNETK